jgi:hypothetical protein
MDWEKEPKLKEFAETFTDYLKDVGCMDNPEGWMGSHKIVSRIRIECTDGNDDTDYEVCGLEYDQLMGCGCPADIRIMIRRVE